MKIDNLTKLEVLKIDKSTIIFSPLANDGSWCRKPYEDHPQGCINFGKPLCPPNTPYLKDKVLSYSFFYLIHIYFNFEKYKDLQKKVHPKWSERQLGNSRHWQSQIKVMFKKKIPKNGLFLACGSGVDGYCSMEAVGINVLAVYRKNKLEFEVKPKSFIRFACLVCTNEELREKPKLKQLKLMEV